MTTVVLEHLQHANSASPDLTVGPDGNIGIGGVAAPSADLEIKPTGGDGELKITSDANGGNNMRLIQGYNSYINASNNVYISAGGNTDMFNLVNGNVGIGTSSPTASSKLHITDGDVQIALEGTGGSNKGYINFDGSSLQMSTNRDLKTGAFANSSKSNATMMIRGIAGGSEFRFYTTTSNNTTATNTYKYINQRTNQSSI